MEDMPISPPQVDIPGFDARDILQQVIDDDQVGRAQTNLAQRALDTLNGE